MVIDRSVQYDGGFLPDIILLTQVCYHYWGRTRLNTMYLVVASCLCPCNSILLLPCVMVYKCLCLFLLIFMVSLHGA